MPYFVLLKTTQGKRFLVNLDACVGIGEGDHGEAVAMSIAGVAVPTGEKFDVVMKDMLGEIKP